MKNFGKKFIPAKKKFCPFQTKTNKKHNVGFELFWGSLTLLAAPTSLFLRPYLSSSPSKNRNFRIFFHTHQNVVPYVSFCSN